MKTPRDRALAHIKTLAAASMVLGCHSGYGVVDPMPRPSCFESPKAVVNAKVLETKDDGTRLVELVATFEQSDAKFNALTAYRIKAFNDASDNKLAITEQTINAHDLRVVIAVPKGAKALLLFADVQCAGRTGFSVEFELDDAGAVTITRVS